MIVQDASGYVGRPMSIALQARLLDEFGPRVYVQARGGADRPAADRAARGHRRPGARLRRAPAGSRWSTAFAAASSARCPAPTWSTRSWRCGGHCTAGDEDGAYRIWLPLAALVSLQHSLDAFLAIEKYLLVKQGIFSNTIVRGPVGYALDEPTRGEVDRLFDRW